jgi:Transposase DDE domain
VPFKAKAAYRRHIAKQRHRVTNWAEYDAGLRARGSLTVWFTSEAIAAWVAAPRTSRGGQASYSDLAIATTLTLRAVFRLALRQTEGLISSILQLLDLDLPVPDHSTLSRRAETLEVPRPKAGSEPVHLLVDSTGLRLCGPGEWLIEKHGTKRRRAWRVLHLATDADTGHIVASVLTDKDADDGSQLGPLLERIEGAVASVTGDGAYDRDDVYAEVAARHPEAAVVVPPRANAVSTLWPELSSGLPASGASLMRHQVGVLAIMDRTPGRGSGLVPPGPTCLPRGDAANLVNRRRGARQGSRPRAQTLRKFAQPRRPRGSSTTPGERLDY